MAKVKFLCKKSGTQGLRLKSASNAFQQAVSGLFCGSYALTCACLASCHALFVFPLGGAGEPSLGMFPGVWEYRHLQAVPNQGGGSQFCSKLGMAFTAGKIATSRTILIETTLRT